MATSQQVDQVVAQIKLPDNLSEKRKEILRKTIKHVLLCGGWGCFLYFAGGYRVCASPEVLNDCVQVTKSIITDLRQIVAANPWTVAILTYMGASFSYKIIRLFQNPQGKRS